MNKLEKDVLTLMLINNYIKPKKLSEYLSNYDIDKINELFHSSRFMKDEETANRALTDLADELYSRILKKLT